MNCFDGISRAPLAMLVMGRRAARFGVRTLCWRRKTFQGSLAPPPKDKPGATPASHWRPEVRLAGMGSVVQAPKTSSEPVR